MILVAICSLVVSGQNPADDENLAVPLRDGTVFRFVGLDAARRLLGTDDAYTRALSRADLSLRFGSEEVSYPSRASAEAREWSLEGRRKLTAAIELVAARFAELNLDVALPASVLLVQSTGAEEGGAGNYTRGTAIVIPASQIDRPTAQLQGVVAHELFHVLTRHRPQLREPLYAIIGFTPCGPVPFPAALTDRKITNPDAFHFEYCIEVTHNGRATAVLPITIMSDPPAAGGSLFDSLEVRLLAVTAGSGAERASSGQPVHYGLDEVVGFFEQVGANTDYIVHPEEILADNFSMLLRGETELANPEILERLHQVLSDERR